MRPAQRADDALLAEINITPFTDVLLVLLIIFMILAALLVPPGFERAFPNCGFGMPTLTPKTATVNVTRNGAISIDGNAVTVSGLYERLASIHAYAPRERVAIAADARAPYGAVIRVVDAAKAGGITDVTFVTQ